MNDLGRALKTQKADKAPAQVLVHGLFGCRVATPAEAAAEIGKLTGKAA